MSRYTLNEYIEQAYERNQELYYNNPEWLDQMRHNIPKPFNFWFDMQFNKKVAEEAKRRDEDLYRNTGQSWKNSPYPFMAYQSSYTGRNNYGSADSFEATSSVISLYKRWW